MGQTVQMEETQTKKTHFLLLGTIFAHGQPHVITTVLGSCVSVCLWDPVLRAGGMNHYHLPLWNGEGLPTPKYGNIAIPKLLESILALGCRKQDLKAKVFGGTGRSILQVGKRNIELAEEMLAEEGIPIVSFDVGGTVGRKIIFDTETGIILLKKFKQESFQQKGS